MTPADNPHKPGTDEWREWEQRYISHRTRDPLEYAEMAALGRKRMNAVKARTVWTERQAEVAAVLAEVEEATRECVPGRVASKPKVSATGCYYSLPLTFDASAFDRALDDLKAALRDRLL